MDDSILKAWQIVMYWRKFRRIKTQFWKQQQQIIIIQSLCVWRTPLGSAPAVLRIRFLLPLSCSFYVRTRVNKIETMFERSRVNVKVEPRSTFTFTRGCSYIASILLITRVKFTWVAENLRHSGNQPWKISICGWILWCNHSNGKLSVSLLTHGAIYFSKFLKNSFG